MADPAPPRAPRAELCLPTAERPGAAAGLPAAEPLHLRLEFDGESIRTLCSRDGQSWLLSGEEPFTPSAPVHIGVYADGHYDWHWVVTRFSDFRIFRL